MRLSICALGAALVAGWATSSSDIRPTYVSSSGYQHLTCPQIAAGAERVSRRAYDVAGVQDSDRTTDALVTAGAIVLYWPAAFFVQNDGNTAVELGRLKGEFEALEKVGIEKNCGLQVQGRR